MPHKGSTGSRGKRSAPQAAGACRRRQGGWSSREDRRVDPSELGPPTGSSGGARTTMLVPHAGGLSIPRPGIRCRLPLASAMALPRKTAWWIHAYSVPYEFLWPSLATLLEPNAGAEFSPTGFRFCCRHWSLDSRLLCALTTGAMGHQFARTSRHPAVAFPVSRLRSSVASHGCLCPTRELGSPLLLSALVSRPLTAVVMESGSLILTRRTGWVGRLPDSSAGGGDRRINPRREAGSPGPPRLRGP